MGRPHRPALGGYVYHVLNRANARLPICEEPEDFAAFERVLEEAVERYRMRLLSYAVMSNHWHLVVWPRKDEELSEIGKRDILLFRLNLLIRESETQHIGDSRPRVAGVDAIPDS